MISVVIPTHNRVDDLKRALQSVYVQTVFPNEIIVIDDGSSPAVTKEIFADTPKQIKTILLRNEQAKGAPNARNRGIEAASSEWIAFLDDDDEFTSDKIEKVEQCIKENNDADVIYHRAAIHMANENVTYLTPDLKPVPINEQFHRLLVKNFVGSTPVVICKRDVLIKVGKFDEKLKLRQDYELWLRCAKFGCKFVPLNYSLTNFNSVTTKSSVSKGVELYKSTMNYIQEKYKSDFAQLSKKEKRKFDERMNDEMIHKYLLNGKMKEARLLQIKQIFVYPSLKNIVSFAALLFGFKFTLRLKAMTRYPKSANEAVNR